MKKFFLSFLLLLTFVSLGDAKIKVHTIGDSTMADYDENATDKRGWCQYLQSFFDADSVIINNRGKSGADTRQFYTSANLWASVKSQMSAGDYLLIQFAHNDEGTVTYGMDNLEYAAYCTANGLTAPTDARGTNPQTTYRDYLRLFIDEARELGVNPVLVGPICRKYFNGNTIKRNGKHDLGDKFSKIENGVLYTNQSVPSSDHSMDYVEAMRIVAQEKNVPFVDLTSATENLYLQYGEAQCTSLLFCAGDNTHLQTMGANLIGRLGAQLLKNQGILSSYIDVPTTITASPSSLSFGSVYSGVKQQKEVLLTGFELQPASGTLSISASANLQVSTDKTNYASTASVSYSGGSLFQRLYINAQYVGSGAQNDSVVVTCGDLHLVIPVSADVIELSNDVRVSATWPIASKTDYATAQVEGPISAEMTLVHMLATDTKSDFSDGSTFVRFHNADDAGAKTAWPANEIDENVTRYIDFAITAPVSDDLHISRISMTIAPHSTSAMCCHINTGFGDDMEGVQTIYEKVNMTNLLPVDLDFSVIVTVPAGETFHVRILPWHNMAEEKSGKYICIKNVVIESGVSEVALENTESASMPSKILRNGQIVILHNGAEYNLLGQLQ